ncbi:MAG: 1-acyl-sn-glycerol-3-phosphate acyltransferase [Myxococcales bacterium]|nr:1-acyl-sn-glycerol-3-phosphate acyltransferase [Myxococcales bacterium]
MEQPKEQVSGFYGPYPRPEPSGVAGRSWQVLRGCIIVLAGWSFCAVAFTLASAFALVTFRIGSAAYFHHVAGVCARLLLALHGVRVELINPELFTGRRARVVFMNHSSQLDLFIMSTVLPPYGTTLAKKQVYYIPFFNFIFFAFAIPTIDRSNLKKAIATLKNVGALVKKRQATVCIAPEGTRARDGKLGPFKKGPFHLAAALDVPVVIAVIKGGRECLPMGRLVSKPGVVRVEMVVEIPGERFTTENIDEMRDEVRAIYLRELGISDD